MHAPPKNAIKRLSIPILGGAVAVALATAAVGTRKEPTTSDRPDEVEVSTDQRALPRDARFGTSFAPIVKKVAPSVVKIFTTTKMKQTSFGELPWSNDPFFRRFFGDEFDRPGRRRQFSLPPQHGVGSGVI